jgi:signal transduction histidine kinase
MKHVVEANEGFARQMGVALALDRPEEAVAAEVDPDRFEQVLTNLISNAVKFSPRGGTVELSLERDHAHAHIAVRDHGLGIPVDFQPQVFQRFSQADSSDTRQKGGTGLGLHIARAIVERLGGSVGFETTPGAGTTFHVRVPLADEARRQPPIKDREPEEVSP